MSNDEPKNLVDLIVRDYPALANDRTLLKRFMDAKGWVEDSLKVFEYLNVIREGGMLMRLQGALSALSFPGLSEIAFIIETLAKIGEANLYAVRMLGQKAYAYGATAWAFRHPMPPLPYADAQKLRQWSGERKVKLGEAEWSRMGEAAMTALLRRCTQQRIHSGDFKLLIQLSFDNQPTQLAKAIYRGFEVGTTFERDAHRSLPCNYPT
ncbi:MAG: hypothetical protein JXA73_11530 [Acidobacteria bacterium]|nr:hypothetical protein [Acidobacteriota bacterium]